MTFKIVGVLLIVGFIPSLADLVRAISPVAGADLTGVDKLAAETPRQIANAHTIFNVGMAIVFLPLSGLFARFCEWAVPDRPLEEAVIARVKFLDEALITTPALALDRARLEIGHMGECVEKMVDSMMPTVLTGNQQALTDIARMDDEVDILHGKIVTYLGRVSRQSLTDSQSADFTRLMAAANALENIGDIVETDLVALGRKRIDGNVFVSRTTQKVLADLHKSVANAFKRALQAVTNSDELAAQDVISMKSEINRLADAASAHQASRLVAEEPNRLSAYSIEVDIIEKLKRVYYFAKRIAKAVAPEELSEKVD